MYIVKRNIFFFIAVKISSNDNFFFFVLQVQSLSNDQTQIQNVNMILLLTSEPYLKYFQILKTRFFGELKHVIQLND